jgi:hypothetical protein
MRFLADESCDFAIVRAVREAGYDVEAVGEIIKELKIFLLLNMPFRKKEFF